MHISKDSGVSLVLRIVNNLPLVENADSEATEEAWTLNISMAMRDRTGSCDLQCASSHLNSSVNSLSENFNTCMYPSISIGDGHSILPTPFKSLHLNNVLITPHIVKNLIYVRQFVRDNNCTIEFDAFGFSVKDFMTRRHTWHQRLGHPGREVLRHLVSNNFISCNKEKPPTLCHACQLGKHVRLPFVNSNTVVTSCFDIIHSDVWTSSIPSLSRFM
ncbi:ribonuclease H-like domain-containing protein [Tanacetum coccineum]